ncbi:HAD hydrolase family protein [Pseudomaricurvus alkylphenolicus]|uniref:HAD family hydrolase n=1 Tax=Pseudomaricurvus alkylphenolicus TaxID=1306991 RepID=UPI001420AA86|nr:HAD family hydrolase [Pseudomaricurvus alkylphenolicus]NIB43708.1 HAD hydrolase family protein [Pseudomaricurvus alkylphenolicus]
MQTVIQSLSEYPLKNIRLAFFDVDGTLLGLDGHYTEHLRRTILHSRELGIKTAIASGRPKFASEYLIEELQLTDAGMFYTGALLFDPSKNLTLEQIVLDTQVVEDVVETARSMGLYTELCTRDDFYVESMPEVGLRHSEHLRVTPKIHSFDSILQNEPVIKLLFAVTSRPEHDLLFKLESMFPQLVFAYAKLAAEPHWLFVSVIDAHACKERAFQQLLDYHDVSADQVVAFGDAHSDIQFLRQAGLGIAMGNANADVQAVADLVTSPVWEDGVALVLEEINARQSD